MCSRSGDASSGRDYATSAVSQDGDTIDLTGSPLLYGKSAEFTDKQKATLKAFEDKRLKAKIEFGILVDADGNVIAQERGGKGSVSMYTKDWEQAEIMTHNHPRAGNGALLGGTFSTQDVVTFSKFDNAKTMRAVASEGTYNITKGSNFDKSGFVDYARQIKSSRRSELNATRTSLMKKATAGEISYSEYAKAYDKSFNTYLVNTHNDFIAGQKKYGYTYSLERR